MSISLTYLHRERSRGIGDVRKDCSRTSLLGCPIAQWILRNSMRALSVVVEVVHVGCASLCASSDSGGGSGGGRVLSGAWSVGAVCPCVATLVKTVVGFGSLTGGPCNNFDLYLSAAVVRSLTIIGESTGTEGAVHTLTTRCFKTSSHVSRLVVSSFGLGVTGLWSVVRGSAVGQGVCLLLNSLTRLLLATLVTTDLAELSGKVANKSVW